MVYEHIDRQFMNELKPQPFITEWYFTSEPQQKEAGTAQWFPRCSGVKSSPRMNSIHYGLWRASNFGCPCLPISERNYAQASSASLAIRRCRVVTEEMSESHTGSDELEAVDVWPCVEQFCSIGPPSVGKRSCRRRENLPRLLSRPNKAAIISLLLNLSPYGRHPALPTHRAVWGGHCYRAESRAKSHARGVGYFLFVFPWRVKSHKLIQLSAEGNAGSKCHFCPVLIAPNSIFFPSYITANTVLSSRSHHITVWVIIHCADCSQSRFKNNRPTF